MKVNELCAVPRLSSLGAAVQIGRERSGSKIRCSGYLGADLLERGDWTVQKKTKTTNKFSQRWRKTPPYR